MLRRVRGGLLLHRLRELRGLRAAVRRGTLLTGLAGLPRLPRLPLLAGLALRSGPEWRLRLVRLAESPGLRGEALAERLRLLQTAYTVVAPVGTPTRRVLEMSGMSAVAQVKP